MLVRLAKLVPDVGAHAWLDAAGAERNQSETHHQAQPGVIERQREVPETIDDGKRQDRAVLAQNRVREKRAEQRACARARRNRHGGTGECQRFAHAALVR